MSQREAQDRTPQTDTGDSTLADQFLTAARRKRIKEFVLPSDAVPERESPIGKLPKATSPRGSRNATIDTGTETERTGSRDIFSESAPDATARRSNRDSSVVIEASATRRGERTVAQQTEPVSQRGSNRPVTFDAGTEVRERGQRSAASVQSYTEPRRTEITQPRRTEVIAPSGDSVNLPHTKPEPKRKPKPEPTGRATVLDTLW